MSSPALASTSPGPHPGPCPVCGGTVGRVYGRLDPVRACREFVSLPCDHRVPVEYARAAYAARIMRSPPEVTGQNLIAAEVAAALDHPPSWPDPAELHWAVWCLLDRAVAGSPETGPPPMWPGADHEWPVNVGPLRDLIVAGALIAEEINRRLAAVNSET